MECETQESEAGYTEHLNLCEPKTNIISEYRINQHLIVLNLCSVSIKKILVMEFIIVKFHRILI